MAGKGSRFYTLTELAAGTGLSLGLVSKIFSRKLPITPYAATRLAEFFGITIEQLFTAGTIVVETPPVRRLARAVYKIHRDSTYRPPVRDWRTALQEAEALESEPVPACPTGAEVLDLPEPALSQKTA
ncbi:MAG: helix-turn-helix domain-containing protein [Terriglobales bacterium]